MGNGGSTVENSRKDRNESSESTDGPTSKQREQRRKEKPKKNISKSSQNGGKGSTNPFLIFFLRVRSKKPNENITSIARKAGKAWGKMTPNDRQKYVDLANAEKKRRAKKNKISPKNKSTKGVVKEKKKKST